MRPSCVLLVVFMALPIGRSTAGEIVKKTYYDAKGNAISGYVYQAGSSRRTSSRSTYRYGDDDCAWGYWYPFRRTYVSRTVRCRPVHYGSRRGTRPVAAGSRGRVGYRASRGVVTGGASCSRGGVTVYRR